MKFIVEVDLEHELLAHPMSVANLLESCAHQLNNWAAQGMTDLREPFHEDGTLFVGEMHNPNEPGKPLLMRMQTVDAPFEGARAVGLGQARTAAKAFGELKSTPVLEVVK